MTESDSNPTDDEIRAEERAVERDLDRLEIEADLFDEVEQVGGPKFRRLEERADGRGLMRWDAVLAHEDVELTPENVPELAGRLVAARQRELGRIRYDEGRDAYDEFVDCYMK